MNTRLKEIDDIVNSIKSQNDYELEIEEKIKSFKEKFSNELEGYEHVPSLFKFYSMKPGGYVRYVNLKGQIKYGGILVKAFESEDKSEFNKKNLLLIQNSNSKQWVISWKKIISFKSRQRDNLRNLFPC